MRNVRRRLHRLEQVAQLQPPPIPLEQITGRALENLSTPHLELLWAVLSAGKTDPKELTECEAAAPAAWQASLEAEARRMGFRSFAEAERIARQRG